MRASNGTSSCIFLPPPLLKSALVTPTQNPHSHCNRLSIYTKNKSPSRLPSDSEQTTKSNTSPFKASAPPRKPSPVRKLLRSAFSGAIAEVVVNLALYPLDTLKVRTQYSVSNVASLKLFRHAFAGVRAGILSSAFDAFVFTFVYEAVRYNHATHRKQSHSTVSDFIAGGVASIASAAVDAPFALARDRIRLGMNGCMRTAWKSAGSVRGVYSMAIPALMRDVPAEGIEFAAYDGLKRLLFQSNVPSASGRLMLGAVAGALMGAVCTPLDLAVTRIVAKPQCYNGGVFKAIIKVAREEGAKATFTSLPHRAFREAFSSALFFAIYDGLKVTDGAEEE